MNGVGGSSDQVRVAVRLRPFNRRERDQKCLVEMRQNQTVLKYPKEEKAKRAFAFDHCFDSSDPSTTEFADQRDVFIAIGEGVLENAFNGYNACIFAYGQTGSGKSYTMIGNNGEPGLIPRLCGRLFERIDEQTDDCTAFKVEVSYMEIYNERVHDLLNPRSSTKTPLKVREHNVLGPIVDGLSVLAVSSFEQVSRLMDEGNKCRTVAATNMNTESSRSHAVFTLRLTQTITDLTNSFVGEKVSKLSLVDLAGSERAQKTGAVGRRLEEGGNINKSLTTLGMVISALAEKSGTKKEKFVPYRDSVLTWLLKDHLGGNSKTVMIATISPAMENFEETLSTLRYADSAKKIVNHAVVNEDPNAKIIRELREEVDSLRFQISQSRDQQNEAAELRDRLAASEELVAQMNRSWAERLRDTEKLHQQRQRDFADIGISVADAGIKVDKDCFYLVNLNADPSMNELLVYYINKEAIIGSGENGDRVDFRLQGLGIQSVHAMLEIMNGDHSPKLFISSLHSDAGIRINGISLSEEEERRQLRNGDRLLIGNNHFFRVNCPKASEEEMSVSGSADYNRAWLEANADSALPINSVIEQIAIRHEEEKKAALERQYEEFERYLHGLAHNLQTPSTPITPALSLMTPSSQLPPISLSNPRNEKSRFMKWAERREELLKESLDHLKTEIVRANALAREGNMLASELWGRRRGIPHYDVTLQIPASNLRPSKIKAGNSICEPVIVVKRYEQSGQQLWTMDQMEEKLIDMRELFTENRSNSSLPLAGQSDDEPILFQSQEKHSLIGVANVFLEVLFHDLRLDYHVPIISQQGEVCGRLHVEVYRIRDDSVSPPLLQPDAFIGKTINCRVRIKKANGLPKQLSHFVFCQYSFFGFSEMFVVAPIIDPKISNSVFRFEHQKDFSVTVTEEFLDYVKEDALSIEIWGHRSSGLDEDFVAEHFSLSGSVDEVLQNHKSLQERWAEVTRRIELWVDIQELDENGQYTSVEVTQSPDIPTGGIYQLRQGMQRRLSVRLRQSTEKGALPLSFLDISTVSVGSLVTGCCRPSDQHVWDSYQEEGLEQIRSQWNKALDDRQKYLSSHIGSLQNPKSPADEERESSLIRQWIQLTDERNSVCLPAPNSNIPGAPADWTPPIGIENHIPVVFLDIDPVQMTAQPTAGLETEPKVAGLSALLSHEEYDRMVFLPVVEKDDIEMRVTCSWDSSLHKNSLLNKPLMNGESVFGIVRVVVRLSYPVDTELVIRKRICLNVYKKPSLTQMLMRRIVGGGFARGTGVYYDVVAHIPKSSLDMEDRSSLALMAAHSDAKSVADRAAYIEAYTKSIQTVESMLMLDRLRQESAVLNMLSRQERAQRVTYHPAPNSNFRMKRTISLPNTSTNILPPLPPKLNGNSENEPNALTTVHNRLMEISTSSSSSGYASMVNSFASPIQDANASKLAEIGEENIPVETCFPSRSITVPESLCMNSQNENAGRQSSRTNHLFQNSLDTQKTSPSKVV